MFQTLSLSKALTLGCHINVRVLRDHAKREAFAAAEQTRQALRYVGLPPPPQLNHPTSSPPLTRAWEKNRYIAQNTQLPLLQRTKAQVELALMNPNARRMKIKNRCIATGRGRGVFRNFRICRVSALLGGEGFLEGPYADRSGAVSI